MKFPNKRPTVAIEKFSKYGYARYDHWIHSIQDYMLYQNYIMSKRIFKSKEQYFKYLDKIYCESPGYSKKLKKIISSNHLIFKDTVDINLEEFIENNQIDTLNVSS